MRKDWLALGLRMAATPSDYWAGGKKIQRAQRFSFPDPLGPFKVEDIGYTRNKMAQLVRNYIHEDSLSSAADQWNNRRKYKPRSHWSVGFSCYNHILKAHSKTLTDGAIGSVMGPCLQSVVITHTISGVAEVEVFYRTTEIFRKFPADLVLIRDHMLSRFDWDRTPLGSITFNVVNMTVSPTYVSTALILAADPVDYLEQIREGDPTFFKLSCRWTHGMVSNKVHSFNQARRAQLAVKNNMTDERRLTLLDYVESHMEKAG